MEKKIKYSLIKEIFGKKIKSLKINNSYNMNINKKISGGISVNKLVLHNPTLIDRVVSRKIAKKFASLLELILDDSDGNDPGHMVVALTEAEKFKRELINKYNRYLKKEKIEFNNKKIEVIEKEIKQKLYEYSLALKCQARINELMNNYYPEEYQEEREMETHRSR